MIDKRIFANKRELATPRKVRVGFFASSFFERFGSGTGKHFYLVCKLFANDFKSKIEITLFCNNNEQYLSLKKNPEFFNANIILLPNVRGNWLKSSRQYFKYALKSKKNVVDIIHFSTPRFYPFFWLFPARKFVCTFHAGGDITAEKDNFILSRTIYNYTAKIFYRKLNSIIAVSEIGKQEISDSYGVPLNLIKVIHVGTNDIWRITPKKLQSIKPNNKILVVVIGRWQKYKNVQYVANVISESNEMELKKFYFVFVGKKITSNSKLITKILENVDSKFYTTIEYLNDVDYCSIVAMADVVIVPSVNEGFSHPVFDAFSFGTRVIFHSPSPAAQILEGRQGVFTCNFNDSNNLLKLIDEAVQSPKADLQQNRNFLSSIEATWEDVAKNYFKVYKDLVQKSSF